MLKAAGVFLTGFYYCPHHPLGKVSKYAVECFCRKPQPGMLYRAALEHGIRLSDSWLVSDLLPDIEAGNRAGCKTVLIDDSYQAGWRFAPIRQPKFTVKNLESAARAIAWGSLSGTETRLWGEKQRSSRFLP
jgi:histidinol phosphatase-like enzyme